MAQPELTTAQIMQGKLLSSETVALHRQEVDRLTDHLTSIIFSANPEEREIAILSYVEAQARRNVFLALIRESAETYQELSQLDTPRRG